MMTNSLDRFAFLSADSTDNPYLSFPVAVEVGVLADPESKAKPLDDPAGVILANGHIPNSQGAGLVDTGHEIIAYDLTSLDLLGSQIRISSSPKSSVDKVGQITAEGVVVLQNQTGLLRLVAFAIDNYKRPWLADRMRSPRSRYGSGDRISVYNTSVLDIPDLEVAEVDLVTNSVIAKVRRGYY